MNIFSSILCLMITILWIYAHEAWMPSSIISQKASLWIAQTWTVPQQSSFHIATLKICCKGQYFYYNKFTRQFDTKSELTDATPYAVWECALAAIYFPCFRWKLAKKGASNGNKKKYCSNVAFGAVWPSLFFSFLHLFGGLLEQLATAVSVTIILLFVAFNFQMV